MRRRSSAFWRAMAMKPPRLEQSRSGAGPRPARRAAGRFHRPGRRSRRAGAQRRSRRKCGEAAVRAKRRGVGGQMGRTGLRLGRDGYGDVTARGDPRRRLGPLRHLRGRAVLLRVRRPLEEPVAALLLRPLRRPGRAGAPSRAAPSQAAGRSRQAGAATLGHRRGYSSAGRAPGSHPGGRRFEPG